MKLEAAIAADYSNIAGMVVRKDGETVYERYFGGCTAESRLNVFSVTKSIILILLGIALDRGCLGSIDQQVLEFFPEYTPKRGEKTIQNITIRDMLTMAAPYKYRSTPYTKYFTSPDWVRFSLDLLGGKGPVGEFRYAPLIGPDILTGILTWVTGQSVLDFAKERLFAPLGIPVEQSITFRSREELMAFYESTDLRVWAADPAGVNAGGWGLTLSPMDLAKLGQLYLDGGVADSIPFRAAEKLGFAAPCANSLDGVSDRDFCIELANAISICMMHLSRLSEEIILWCSWEFKFIELDDAFTTGSSIMPQKKNPDVTELIRGKTGRVYGDLNTLLVMMKGIPLAYNKDMQEDKEAIFDAVDTLELCLKTVTPMLDTMKTLPANMRRAAAKGFINATDCADYLTKKGMPFRDAYKLTGCMVSDCIAKDKTLEELTLDEFKGYSALFENDIYDAIDLIKCCEGRTSYGGPSEASVNNQIRLAMDQLAAWEANNA